MEQNKHNNINLSTTSNKQEVSNSSTNTLSLTGNLSISLPKRVIDMNELLQYIRDNQPLSMWKLSKALNIPNSSLYYKIRDLEFAGLIYSKVVVNGSNRTERLIYSINKGVDTNGLSS